MFEEGPQGERPEGSAEINSGSLPVRNKVKTMKIGGICELLPPPSTSSSKLSPSRGEDNNVFGLTETILPLNSPSAKKYQLVVTPPNGMLCVSQRPQCAN